MGRKRWNRVEQAEDILDECFEVLNAIPLSNLRKGDVAWFPSEEFIKQLAFTRDRIYRYMKQHKLNGWSHED